MMGDSVLHPEFFSLASQLYVQMRRSGRVVDAVYMAKNQDYAREILQLASRETNPEIVAIVARFETLLEREYPSKEIKQPEPVVIKEQPPKANEDVFSMTLRPFKKLAAKQQTQPELPVVKEQVEDIEEEVAHHYVGALR
ncbi:MAG: hypothetical protein KDI39_02865 [Pseudomonadales bacterium]|nr:hypothetical protein [Pseudomonadales bacterium]